MRKQLIACGVLTLGLLAFGCQNTHHDDNSMPTTQKAEAAPQQDNTAVAQNDDTSVTDTEAQENETPSPGNESTESVAQNDNEQAQAEDNGNTDESNTEEAPTDESATTDDGEQTEVAEIWDGTQFDADEFVQQVLEASTQDPFTANTNTKNTPSQKKVNTASTDGGDPQP